MREVDTVGWFKRLKTFLSEVVAELKKTTWPSRTEVRGTTTVVIITMFIIATFLWIVDQALGRLYFMTISLFK